MRTTRGLVAATILGVMLGTTGGCQSDWTCPGCRHDANIHVENAGAFDGQTAFVRIVSAGGRSVSGSFVLHGDETDHAFTDFIREGGGPYETLVFVDFDADGTCQEGRDPAWRESFDDDETLWVVDMGDPRSTCR